MSYFTRLQKCLAIVAWMVACLLPRAVPTAVASGSQPGPRSWLRNATILTIYGRAFNTAPVLGRLGMDRSFADMAAQVQPFVRGMRAGNGGQTVRIAVHLIYGMASPCSGGGNCLAYLDSSVNIVKQYIEPAAKRGWLVILDDQLGLSTPEAEARRILARGYLRYDNVGVAFDAEFRARPGQIDPGVPIGTVTASELNQAQTLIGQYSARLRLPHRKIVLIHQFHADMIQQRGALRRDLRYVDPVVIADGFGTPGLKARIYSELLGYGASAGVVWRGIKLFYPNPYEHAGHADWPVMSWPQVFGRAPAIDGGRRYYVRPAPQVVIVA